MFQKKRFFQSILFLLLVISSINCDKVSASPDDYIDRTKSSLELSYDKSQFSNLITIQVNKQSELVALSWDAKSNIEQFVSLDPKTGIISVKNTIPSIRYVMNGFLDPTTNVYFHWASDETNTMRLYRIDANSGQVLSITTFSYDKTQFSNLIGLTTNSDGTLLALSWDSGRKMEQLVKLNYDNSTIEKISDIPNIKYVSGELVMNMKTNEIYAFGYGDDTSVYRIYTINANSGEYQYECVLPINQKEIYNIVSPIVNNEGALIALSWNDIDKMEYIIRIDPSNGNITTLGKIPGIQWVWDAQAFDPSQDAFYYLAHGVDTSKTFLFLIDASTPADNPFLTLNGYSPTAIILSFSLGIVIIKIRKKFNR